MFTVLKEQTGDPWVARSKKLATRGQRIGFAIAVGVGLVVLVMIGSFVVGRLLG
jgi:cell division protein FtsX